VVVGSGPGGLQISYFLSQLGIGHAALSADPVPGGMFRRYPLFQRLITWSKPHAPADRGTRPYGWYDWNSLLADEPLHLALVPEFMDGTSYFPSRLEMERGLTAFAKRARVQVRYDTRWEATRRSGDEFVLITSDGEYQSRAVVFAVGMAEPWKPSVAGMDAVPHYVQTRQPRTYTGQRVVIVGKRNSGFEVADSLLPWARQIILLSPRPALLSIHSHSTAGVRARYLLPYEDHVLGGGVFVLDATTDRVEPTTAGFRLHATGTTQPGAFVFDAEAVIAATGFTAPLGDLRALGVATFNQDRIPALTPFW
jgi:thioredoxin reductase